MIEQLESYMLNNKNLLLFLKNEINNNKLDRKDNPNKNNVKRERFFYPKYKDTLFWCFYILNNGFSEYEIIGTHNFKKEKEMKFIYIEKIKENKEKIKQFKLKKNEIIDNLLNDEFITIFTFHALCLCYNINVLYIDNKKFFEILVDDNIKHIIHKINDSYCLEDFDDDKKNYYIKNYWRLENLKKPIKSVSNYKVDELRDIATLISLTTTKENGKNKTKQELYDEIMKNI